MIVAEAVARDLMMRGLTSGSTAMGVDGIPLVRSRLDDVVTDTRAT
jgi:hypothetical protein